MDEPESSEATEQPIVPAEPHRQEWYIEATRRWTETRLLLNGEPIPFQDLGLYVRMGGPSPEMWLQLERAMVHAWDAEGGLDVDRLYPPVPEHPTVLTLGLLPHRVVFEGSPVVYIRVGHRRFRVIEATETGGLFDG